MKIEKRKDGIVDSIVSLLIFIIIFVPFVIISGSAFLKDYLNNGLCILSDTYLSILAWGCIVFIPILCCYILGKDAVKMYNESSEKKPHFRKKINELNVKSLFLIKLVVISYFIYFLFFEFSC